MWYVWRLAGNTATLVLVPFLVCGLFLHGVERDESILGRFEFLQYRLGYLGSPSFRIADDDEED